MMWQLQQLVVGVTSAVILTRTSATPPPPPPALGCGQWKHGMNLAGHDMSNQQTMSAGECCELCKKTVGASRCLGWTWNGPPNLGCYFKNGVLRMERGAPQQVSSVLGPGPPLPIPPPPPPLCHVDPPNQCAWYNSSLPFGERRDRLIAEMTPSELLKVIGGGGCARLHVTADGFNECVSV
jgi:hypothetical protein